MKGRIADKGISFSDQYQDLVCSVVTGDLKKSNYKATDFPSSSVLSQKQKSKIANKVLKPVSDWLEK